MVRGNTDTVKGKCCVLDDRQVRRRLGLATFPAKVIEYRTDLSHFVTQHAPLTRLTSFASPTVMVRNLSFLLFFVRKFLTTYFIAVVTTRDCFIDGSDDIYLSTV